MRLVVYGAGGIGGVIGGRLFQAGADVTLIARGAHGLALRQSGLQLIAPDGRFDLPVPTVLHPDDINWRGDEVVLATIKSQQSGEVLKDLRAAAPDSITYVCAQNGVSNEPQAANYFSRVVGMVVWLPAVHLQAGEVVTHAQGKGGVLDCGLYPEGVDQQIVALAELLEAAGFSARPDPHIMRFKYAKLLANLGNAIQATVGWSDGANEIMRAARQEALACYAAAGIACADRDEVQARQKDLYRMVDIDGYPRGGGSTWQSVTRGTGNVETDHLNGEIVRLGEQHGVSTPVNAAICNLMQMALREGAAPGDVPLTRLQMLVQRNREF